MSAPGRAEPKRDRYGRYLLPEPGTGGERAYSRTTTVVKTLPDQTTLTKWKLRQTLKGVAARPELLDVARTTDDRGQLDSLADAAMDAAGSNDASAAGTMLHEITEQVDLHGEAYEVPVEHDADVAAYVDATRGAGLEFPPEYIERIVVNPAVDAAGTFDRIVRLPSGRLLVADLKTGKDLTYSWLEIASQLAVYANAVGIFNGTGYDRMPDVDLEVGLVFHLPVGRAHCTIYEVDLSAGWELAQLAAVVRRERGRRNLARAVTAAGLLEQPLHESIANATTTGQLDQLWAEYHRAWTPAHIEAARAKKAELLAAASA